MNQKFNETVISKSIGVIRKCCRSGSYMKVHAQAFEQSLTKIYIFMDDPKSISFEDDIIHIMQAYIKRQKTISPVIWQLFLKLPAVLDKNKHQLKDLFDTVNLFLIEGKAGFTQEV